MNNIAKIAGKIGGFAVGGVATVILKRLLPVDIATSRKVMNWVGVSVISAMVAKHAEKYVEDTMEEVVEAYGKLKSELAKGSEDVIYATSGEDGNKSNSSSEESRKDVLATDGGII